MTAGIETYRGRATTTLYKYKSGTPSAVVISVVDQWSNITGILDLATGTDESGFVLNKDTAGDEFIELDFNGPQVFRVTARIEGGVATNLSHLGILVDRSTVSPVAALADVPIEQRDVATQDARGLLEVTWLLARGVGKRTEEPTRDGQRIRIAVASGVATTLNVERLTVECVRGPQAHTGT